MQVFAPLVGVSFRGSDARNIVKELTMEDGDKLTLESEPNNEYDSNAVKVIHGPSGIHLGYITKENNWDVSEALKDGQELKVTIVGFENTAKPTLLIESM